MASASPPRGGEAKAALLAAPVNPSDLRTRTVGGGRTALYLTGETVISKANALLGYDGWSDEIKCVKVDKAHRNTHGKWTIGVMAHMRVTLKEGNFHEDIGYGSAENMPSWTAALEKAKKSAVTDARKRCLRLFGDALGNCVGNVQFQQSARTAQREAAAASRGGVAVERFSMSDLMQAPAARSEPQTPTAVATGFVTTPSVTTPQHTMPAATTPPTRAPIGGAKRPSPTSTALPAPPPAKRTAGAASPLPASDTGAASATAAATSAPGSALPGLPGGAAVPPKAQGGGGGSTGTAGSALSLSQDNFQLPDDALKVLQAQEAEAERARRIAASKEAALRRLQASRGGEGQSHSQGSVQL